MKHIPALDGLRAAAVTAVVFFHAGVTRGSNGAFMGVDMFFVLSGYLITTILTHEYDRRGRVDVGAFYWRRFFRLVPGLALMLAAYVAVAGLVWPRYPAAAHYGDAAVTLAFLSDYVAAFALRPAYLLHTWSLAVEEHFYLLWPWLLVWLLPRGRALKVVLAACLLAIEWRVLSFWYSPWALAYYRFDTRVDGLLLGSVLALTLREYPKLLQVKLSPAVPYLVFGLIVLQFAAGAWGSPATGAFGITATGLLTVVLIYGCVARAEQGLAGPRVLEWAPVRWIGVMSYGIYLWHYPISKVTRDTMSLGWSFVVCLGLASLMAWLSWHTAERLGRLGRDRLALRRRLSTNATPAA
jgi:peptidoglycan/LPS O-acetylase OafA/YrhL